MSPRRAAPLVKVQCSALPDTLLESELFGYEKGAFTGAAVRKPGRVELAEGGTLFLDEIGDIPLTMQGKLLRLAQDRQYERLGGTKTLSADVRIVAATFRDLEGMVGAGEFRSDLFYRLNVVTVWVPPLRARRDDIPLLAHHFARAFSAAQGAAPCALHEQALELRRERRQAAPLEYAQSLAFLASVYLARNELEQAEAASREAWAVTVAEVGEEHQQRVGNADRKQAVRSQREGERAKAHDEQGNGPPRVVRVPRAAGVERGRDAGETGEADRYLSEYEERVSALHDVPSVA